MDHRRCTQPLRVRNETGDLIADNLILLVMAESAILGGFQSCRIGLKGTLPKMTATAFGMSWHTFHRGVR